MKQCNKTCVARFIGPLEKRKKRLGLSEGVISSRRKVSDFGIRLKEKQKAKFLYGILEKQFQKYFKAAAKNPQNTGLILAQTLERRLDNVVYRLGLAKTRNQARQLVNHGHVSVNDRVVNIPSFLTRVGETIMLKDKFSANPLFQETLSIKEETTTPDWLAREGLSGKIVRLPKKEEAEAGLDMKLIIEYYSR